MATAKKTASERTFERYAGENSVQTHYHPPLNHPECPDYLTRTIAAEVLCEVEEFGPGDLDKAAAAAVAANRVRLPDGTDSRRRRCRHREIPGPPPLGEKT